MNLPQPDEFAPFYANYIKAVGDDVYTVLENQATEIPALLRSIAGTKDKYAYAEGKWTLNELAGHILDTERIMVYRLTTVARKDATPMPGFEENDYVENAHFNDRSLASYADEFELLRKANLFLLKSFTDEELNRVGNMNGNQVSARALLFIVAGHALHHTNIINERYL